MNFYQPTPEDKKREQEDLDKRIESIAKKIKPPVSEWLIKPVVVEVVKYLLIATIAFIGGAYSSEIKKVFSKQPESIPQQTQQKNNAIP